jgi:hypothetical protein
VTGKKKRIIYEEKELMRWCLKKQSLPRGANTRKLAYVISKAFMMPNFIFTKYYYLLINKQIVIALMNPWNDISW